MHEPDSGDHPTQNQLHAFSLGAVGPAELESIGAHLLACEHCCAALESLAARDVLVARLRKSRSPEINSPEDASDRESAVRALRRGRAREAITGRAIPPPESHPLSNPTLDPATPPAAWWVGDYEILAEVGRGGMGVVYKARHRRLNRLVALKMILSGEFAAESDRLRFLREAELAARVKHVNIVQLHEIGHLSGRPYLSMEWVEGGTLADRLDGTAWPPDQAARLIATLAHAIDSAHRQGVLHRDLKPANILMQPGDDGNASDEKPAIAVSSLAGVTPKITDFGLARSLRDQSGLTRTGFVVGTPEYMAPEQAIGDSRLLGPPVDIYALGVILYQLLTGRPPFRAESPAAVLRASASDPPVAPRRIKSRIPRDLDTIVLKSIEKDPTHRYRTAAALGEDLRRFLARADTRTASPRGRTFAQMGPPPAPSRRPRRVSGSGRHTGPGRSHHALAGSRTRQYPRAPKQQCRAQARYRADITAAAGALQLNHTETARRLLDSSPTEFRNWEWRYLTGQLDNSLAAFQPPRALPGLVLLSPDCTRVIFAAAHESVLHMRAVVAGREIAALRGHEAEVLAIAWSKDGSLLASCSADRTVRLWDGATGRPLALLRDHAKPVVKMYLSDDGSRLAIHSSGPDVQIWNVNRRVLQTTIPAANERSVVKLSPHGNLLAVGRSNRVQLWNVDSGILLSSLDCGNAGVEALAFSADGSRLAAGTDYPQNRVWLWETATAKLLATMDGHTNTVCALEFSPDGRRIVSSSYDQSLRLWDTATGQSMATLQGHLARVTAASFHPDGRHLVSASLDGSLRLWDTQNRELFGAFRGETQVEQFALATPDGSLLASIGSGATVHIWDLERVKNAGVLGRHTSFVYDVAFSPSGRELASVGWDGVIRLWDVPAGRALRVLRHPSEIVTAVTFHPDGRTLASAARDQRVYIWNLDTAQSTASPAFAGGPLSEHRIAFAPQGDLVAVTGGPNGFAQLFTLSERSPAVDLVQPGPGTNDMAFSPDGSRLVCGYSDGTIRIWDVALRTSLGVLRGHDKSVVRVAYSADGRKIASASFDTTARLWDAKTLSSLGVLKHPGAVFSAAFNPDGSRLATGCIDNIVRVWDTATFDEVIELRGHSAYVHAVAFSPDGTMLASGSGDFTVRIWDSRSPEERRGLAREAPEVARSRSSR